MDIAITAAQAAACVGLDGRAILVPHVLFFFSPSPFFFFSCPIFDNNNIKMKIFTNYFLQKLSRLHQPVCLPDQAQESPSKTYLEKEQASNQLPFLWQLPNYKK
jgi:hypothetical protein